MMNKTYSPAFKARLVQELLKETKTIAQLAAEHGTHPNVLGAWKATTLQGRGPRRQYGAKLDYQHLPKDCLQQLSVAGMIDTRIYQLEVLHKEFGQPLNVVLIEKVNRRTQQRAHAILFSSDLTLSYDKLIDYYGVRFQIEFTFRDAKQYWGLDDFMAVTATGVTNAANLALFLVNLRLSCWPRCASRTHSAAC